MSQPDLETVIAAADLKTNKLRITVTIDDDSLRDYFAGQALIGLVGFHSGNQSQELAAACYRHADAMLEARKK